MNTDYQPDQQANTLVQPENQILEIHRVANRSRSEQQRERQRGTQIVPRDSHNQVNRPTNRQRIYLQGHISINMAQVNDEAGNLVLQLDEIQIRQEKRWWKYCWEQCMNWNSEFNQGFRDYAQGCCLCSTIIQFSNILIQVIINYDLITQALQK